MQFTKKIVINNSIDLVWKMWAEEFEKAESWMAVVVRSYEKEEGEKVTGAPMIGRICEFSKKQNGPKVLEDIIYYDKANHSMHIRVVPNNVPIPLKQNILKTSLKKLSKKQTEITLDVNPELNWKGYFIYPIIKKGLSNSFDDLLEEFKYYVEQGSPHPRKLR